MDIKRVKQIFNPYETGFTPERDLYGARISPVITAAKQHAVMPRAKIRYIYLIFVLGAVFANGKNVLSQFCSVEIVRFSYPTTDL